MATRDMRSRNMSMSEMSLVDMDVSSEADQYNYGGAAGTAGMSSGSGSMRSALYRSRMRRANGAQELGDEVSDYGSSTALARAGSSLLMNKKAAAKDQTTLPKVALTYVEFVYYARGERAQTVEILGDWNTWEPVPLHDAGQKLWRVVVLLPAGYHEFVYRVDGDLRLSEVHPKTSDGRSNWRHVIGTKKALKQSSSQGRLLLSKSMRDMIHLVSRSVGRSSSVASLVGAWTGGGADELSEMSSVTSSETDEEGQDAASRQVPAAISSAAGVCASTNSSLTSRALYAGIIFFLVVYFALYFFMIQCAQ